MKRTIDTGREPLEKAGTWIDNKYVMIGSVKCLGRSIGFVGYHHIIRMQRHNNTHSFMSSCGHVCTEAWQVQTLAGWQGKGRRANLWGSRLGARVWESGHKATDKALNELLI